MMDVQTSLAVTLAGVLVGLVLGLVGGGGSILAVPLLVYMGGISSPHMAIGTSAIAVSLSAVGNIVSHAHAGNVKWRCATVFAAAGVAGALAGSAAAKGVDGQKLLVLFGVLMVIVGIGMLARRTTTGDPQVRLSMATARELLPPLMGIGFAVGLLSGFFGIGGGFLIVPGLVIATGMPLTMAIGTSLVAVAAFGAATSASYAVSGMVDWPTTSLFVVGALVGGAAGVVFGNAFKKNERALSRTFASLVVLVGLYVVSRGTFHLSAT